MSVMFEHRASWHWLIPGEEESDHGVRVWACAPERRAAWHVRNASLHPDVYSGNGNVNYWSLGLEIVNAQDGDAFSDWQIEQAAGLVRYAWSKYPDLVDVVSHAKLDPTRRTDPGSAYPWERFRELVLAPATGVSLAASARLEPIRVLGPRSERISCDPRSLDGVTFVEARPLVEALGFRVEYEDGPPRTVRIVEGARTARVRQEERSRKPPRRGRGDAKRRKPRAG
jgi:N-acetylmuramoyl-L-alanine amidase